MYGYFTKITHDQGAACTLTYACTHVRCSKPYKIMCNKWKIIQLNVRVCRDGMHHAKSRGNKQIPLPTLSRILAQLSITPTYIILAKDCASILDSIAKGIS